VRKANNAGSWEEKIASINEGRREIEGKKRAILERKNKLALERGQFSIDYAVRTLQIAFDHGMYANDS
jgi:hypothetical protein